MLGKYVFWTVVLFGQMALMHIQTPPPDPSASADTPPSLRIVGAPAAGGIKLNRNVADFQYTFQIESMNQTPATDLRVVVAPLTGPNDEQVDTSWTVADKPGPDATVEVPGLSTIRISITAVLTLQGTYTSSITLIYAGKRETTDLTVTRTRTAPSIEVLGVETVRTPGKWLATDATLRVNLHETEGRPVTLDVPSLTTLVLNEANANKIQARYTRIDVQTETGAPITRPLEFKPGETKRIKLIVLGLQDAGQYTGTLRLTAADSQPIDQQVTIVTKTSWCIAALLILLGVSTSYLYNNYLKNVRPVMIIRRRILTLLSDIDTLARQLPDMTEREQNVLTAFRRRLTDLYEDTEQGNQQTAEAVIKEIDEKLALIPDWVNARRRVYAIQPAKLRKDIEPKLGAAEAVLLDSRATSEQIAGTGRDLAGIGAEIERVVKNALQNQLVAFRKELDRQEHVAHSDRLRKDLQDKVEPLFAAAEQALAGNDVDEGHRQFDRARQVYASILTDDLSEQIVVAPRPPGFDESEWENLKKHITSELQAARQATDPDQAITLYQSAHSYYLRQLARTLQKSALQKIETIEKLKALEDAKRLSFKERLGTIATKLGDTIKQVEEGQLGAAAEEYTTLAESYTGLMNEVYTALPAMMGGIDARLPSAGAIYDAGTIPATTSVASVPVALPRPAHLTRTIDQISRDLDTRDKFVTLVTVAIAVASGLLLLWVDDPTWGGWKDWITAILWGLGLHQVSGNAFEGLTGLTTKLAR